MEHGLAERLDHDGGTDSDEDISLPVAPLIALVGSGTFAAWMSLTCFVC